MTHNRKQQYKVTHLEDGYKVFFLDHAFESAFSQAQRYIERNSGKYDMKLEFIGG